MNHDLESSSSNRESSMTMDQELFKAIRCGDEEKIKKFAEQKRHLFSGTSPKGNTVLHVAARYGNWSMLRRIIELELSFLIQKNKKGETPLRIAAKAGNYSAIDILTCYDDMATLEMLTDNEGNTPLHNAIRNGHELIIIDLINYFGDNITLHVNEAGQSPLYIAIDAGLASIASFLMRNFPSSLDHRGPKRFTLLHSAVIRQHYGIMVEILKCKKELINKLDEQKRNPFHYAAASGNVKIARCLSEESTSLVYQGDIIGQTPIHFAVKNGRLEVLKMLLKAYPDGIEVTDHRDHNILHVAAEYGHIDIVEFILKLHEVEDLINSPDVNGNTPLHMAAMDFKSDVVYILSRNMNVNIRATNTDQQTALDIVETSTVKGKDIQKHLTIIALKVAYANRALDPEDILENRRFSRIEDVDSPGGKRKEMAQTLSVMNTLIATFTFNAAFTIPGGFKSDGPGEGMAILVRRTSFQAFVITDTIAMTSSMTAAVVVFWSFWCSRTESFMDTLPLAIGLTWIGLLSMTLAFVTGLFVVLSSNLALAIVICSIGCALPFIFYVFAPFLSLLFRQSAPSQYQTEVNPFAFSFRMVQIFLKKPFNWSFRCISKRNYHLPG